MSSTKTPTPTEPTDDNDEDWKIRDSSKRKDSTWSEILWLLKMFNKDAKHNFLHQTTALWDLAAFASKRTFLPPSNSFTYKDRALLNTLLEYSKIASAAYGWSLFNRRNPKTAVLMEAGVKGKTVGVNRRILKDHCGIEEEDILHDKWSSTDFDPGHFVALYHRDKAVVISIRGTMHIHDVATDMLAKMVSFAGGVVHEGVYLCAQSKFAKVIPIAAVALQKYSDYKLVITGHSLGGGTAAVLTVMVNMDKNCVPAGTKVECYAFATPAVFNAKLSLSSLCDNIVSISVNDDVITRLSLGTCKSLQSLLDDYLDFTAKGTLRSLWSTSIDIVRGKASLTDAQYEFLNQRIGVESLRLMTEDARKSMDSPEMEALLQRCCAIDVMEEREADKERKAQAKLDKKRAKRLAAANQPTDDEDDEDDAESSDDAGVSSDTNAAGTNAAATANPARRSVVIPVDQALWIHTFPPGVLYDVRTTTTTPPTTCVARANNLDFGNITVSTSMMSDHMPDFYEQQLRAAEADLTHSGVQIECFLVACDRLRRVADQNARPAADSAADKDADAKYFVDTDQDGSVYILDPSIGNTLVELDDSNSKTDDGELSVEMKQKLAADRFAELNDETKNQIDALSGSAPRNVNAQVSAYIDGRAYPNWHTDIQKSTVVRDNYNPRWSDQKFTWLLERDHIAPYDTLHLSVVHIAGGLTGAVQSLNQNRREILGVATCKLETLFPELSAPPTHDTFKDQGEAWEHTISLPLTRKDTVDADACISIRVRATLVPFVKPKIHRVSSLM